MSTASHFGDRADVESPLLADVSAEGNDASYQARQPHFPTRDESNDSEKERRVLDLQQKDADGEVAAKETAGVDGEGQEDEEEELFEIVDFTAASSWERFISSIESRIISWKIDDGRLGVLDPSILIPTQTDAPPPRCISKKEVVVYGDQSYVLSYQYACPTLLSDANATGEKLQMDDDTDEDFPPAFAFNEQSEFIPLHSVGLDRSQTNAPHPLHRWSGHSHLLLVTPFSIPDIFDGESGASRSPFTRKSLLERQSSSSQFQARVDASTSKLLLSSFAIAFHNTSCSVPVFIPIGPTWKSLYCGYQLFSGHRPFGVAFTSNPVDVMAQDIELDALDDESGDERRRRQRRIHQLVSFFGLDQSDVEFRTRMIHVPFVPPEQSHLKGLVEFFRGRLALDGADSPELSFASVLVSSLFTYVIPNHDNQDKLLMDWMSASVDTPLPTPALPFGVSALPIRSFTLECEFKKQDQRKLVDDAVSTEMDPTRAPCWRLVVDWSEKLLSADRGSRRSSILCSILEDIINLVQTELESAEQINASTRPPDDEEDDEDLSDRATKEGTIRNGSTSQTVFRTAVMSALGARRDSLGDARAAANDLPQNSIQFVDRVDVSRTVEALLAGSTNFRPGQNDPQGFSVSPITMLGTLEDAVPTVDHIISRLRDAVAVPPNSFLWRLAHRLMDSLTPTSRFRYTAPLPALTKGIWLELVREFRLLGETGALIPDVDVNCKSCGKDGKSEIGIDLRWSLLHQKLCMLNCCTLTKLARGNGSPRKAREPSSLALSDISRQSNLPKSQLNGNAAPSMLQPPERRRDAAANKLKNQRSLVSLSTRFFATLTDIATDVVAGVANDLAPPVTKSDAPPSTFVRFFDRFMGEDSSIISTDATSSKSGASSNIEASAFKPPQTPQATGSTAIQVKKPNPQSQQPTLSALGTSWSSDRSWEDFSSSARHSIIIPSTSKQQQQHHHGSPIYGGGSFIMDDEESRSENPNGFEDDERARSPTRPGEGPHRSDSRTEGSDLFFETMEGVGGEPFLEVEPPPKAPAGPQGLGTAASAARPIFPAEIAAPRRRDNFAPHDDDPIHLGSALRRQAQKPSSETAPSSFDSLIGSMPSTKTSSASANGSSPPRVGESVLLEGIERVIARSGSTTAAAIAEDQQWAALEVKGEDASEGGIRGAGIKILRTGAEAVVPEVQIPGYMTEDMIREQELVFERLGTSEEAAKIRARMQSAHLKSDMESFKAANPHATIEDFVRWHSPRDWIEDPTAELGGRLSARMLEPSNLWLETWKIARRIPACRQKPLFDHEKEVERALMYLESLHPLQIIQQLVPTFVLIVYDRVVSHAVTKKLAIFPKKLQHVASLITSMSWKDVSHEYDGPISLVLDELRELEELAGLGSALLRQLPMQYDLVNRLLEHGVANVADGKERETVYDLLLEELGQPPRPSSREFVLTTTVQRTAHASRALPQRMYALLKDGDFRVLETVAADTRSM